MWMSGARLAGGDGEERMAATQACLLVGVAWGLPLDACWCHVCCSGMLLLLHLSHADCSPTLPGPSPTLCQTSRPAPTPAAAFRLAAAGSSKRQLPPPAGRW